MKLFEPYQIKKVSFPNRVVIAPMVPFGIPRLPNYAMSNPLLSHYDLLAANGAGLLITQSLSVTPEPLHDSGVGIFDDDQIIAMQTVVNACHRNNTRIFAQLAYPSIGFHNGDSISALTAAQLRSIVHQFILAARRCKQAGCDGIELHGANGFFLNMMASPLSNQRNDEYGSSLDNRLRLVSMIVEGIEEFLNEDFMLSYRMGWNDSLATDIQTAQALQRMGIELLHVCSGISLDSRVVVPKDFAYNAIVYTAAEVKKNVDIPIIAVNDIRTLRRGNGLIEAGHCEFVAYGRPFLADPKFLAHSQENIDYQSCLRCRSCKWFYDGKYCPARK